MAAAEPVDAPPATAGPVDNVRFADLCIGLTGYKNAMLAHGLELDEEIVSGLVPLPDNLVEVVGYNGRVYRYPGPAPQRVNGGGVLLPDQPATIRFDVISTELSAEWTRVEQRFCTRPPEHRRFLEHAVAISLMDLDEWPTEDFPFACMLAVKQLAADRGAVDSLTVEVANSMCDIGLAYREECGTRFDDNYVFLVPVPFTGQRNPEAYFAVSHIRNILSAVESRNADVHLGERRTAPGSAIAANEALLQRLRRESLAETMSHALARDAAMRNAPAAARPFTAQNNEVVAEIEAGLANPGPGSVTLIRVPVASAPGSAPTLEDEDDESDEESDEEGGEESDGAADANNEPRGHGVEDAPDGPEATPEWRAVLQSSGEPLPQVDDWPNAPIPAPPPQASTTFELPVNEIPMSPTQREPLGLTQTLGPQWRQMVNESRRQLGQLAQPIEALSRQGNLIHDEMIAQLLPPPTTLPPTQRVESMEYWHQVVQVESARPKRPPVTALHESVCTYIDDTNKNPSAEFFCPISLCAMRDPVVAPDGQMYDRASIAKQIAATMHPDGSWQSPVTRKRVAGKLYPCKAFVRLMEEWVRVDLIQSPSDSLTDALERHVDNVRRENIVLGNLDDRGHPLGVDTDEEADEAIRRELQVEPPPSVRARRETYRTATNIGPSQPLTPADRMNIARERMANAPPATLIEMLQQQELQIEPPPPLTPADRMSIERERILELLQQRARPSEEEDVDDAFQFLFGPEGGLDSLAWLDFPGGSVSLNPLLYQRVGRVFYRGRVFHGIP